jgi:hypothetical protein
VMHSDGVPTSKYRESLDRVHKALVAMGVRDQIAQRVVNKLMIVAQQVRGPEDTPDGPGFVKLR